MVFGDGALFGTSLCREVQRFASVSSLQHGSPVVSSQVSTGFPASSGGMRNDHAQDNDMGGDGVSGVSGGDAVGTGRH